MEIFVNNLEFVGYHGLYEDEREHGRQYAADLRVDLPSPPAATSDDIEDTVDYRGLAQIIRDVGEGPKFQLIERLADEILNRVLDKYTPVRSATITLRKYATGVPGTPDCVGVRVTKHRDEA